METSDLRIAIHRGKRDGLANRKQRWTTCKFERSVPGSSRLRPRGKIWGNLCCRKCFICSCKKDPTVLGAQASSSASVPANQQPLTELVALDAGRRGRLRSQDRGISLQDLYKLNVTHHLLPEACTLYRRHLFWPTELEGISHQ